MQGRFLRTLLLLAAFFSHGVGASCVGSANDASSKQARTGERTLRFCVCPNSMPRAGRTPDGAPQGVDVALAQLLAEQLQRRCEFHWCGTDACRLKSLNEERCDVVIGLTADSIESKQVVWTNPYAAGKFGLVVRRTGPAYRSLADLRGKRVGVVAGTVPLSASDHTVVRFPSREALLRGFVQAELDGALVDADFAAWSIKADSRLTLRLAEEFVSHHHWNVAMALRVADVELRDALDQAIDRCLAKASFQPLFAQLGLAYLPPRTAVAEAQQVAHTWRELQAGRPLVVSMDPDNLPYSSSRDREAGFDVEIARALAAELGVELELKWMDVHRDTAIGQLLERESDLAFGAAIDPRAVDDEIELADKVIYSQPYYGAGYMLVARRGVPPVASLAELRGEKSRKLGTQAGTIADYSLRQRGYLRRLFGTQEAVLKSLDDGTIDYAYMWSNVGWMLHAAPTTQGALAPDFVPEDRWNIAIAMRRGDTELQQQVNSALGRLRAKGVVAASLARCHTPYFDPFEQLSNANPAPSVAPSPTFSGERPEGRGPNPEEGPDSQAGPNSQAGPDSKARTKAETGPNPTGPKRPFARGLEPLMDRRQLSRRPYDGLQRIRSRGTLIVGLDQNNLPFSTAHPQPAGLDYEIAQLLAAQLEVSLEVYWAYSSHDSYPSKLAHKRLCDVMLGVMPDDRFGDDVAYSDPYYFGHYAYAVAARERADASDAGNSASPIAFEPGAAIHGLAGKSLRPYASLDAILADVAAMRIDAGYVVASRAHWLASQKWPKEIRFVAAEGESDRFPICAAVRRREVDFKEAINAAFQRLRDAGRLQAVFARWHVPMDRGTAGSASPTSPRGS